MSDLENAYYYGTNCIGGSTDKRVRCYVRKDKELNKKDYNIIKYNREKYAPLQRAHYVTSEKGRQIVLAKFRERDYATNKIKESFFNIIDVL